MKKLSKDQIRTTASLFSLTALVIGLIAGAIQIFHPNHIIDTIGVAAFAALFLPFLINQVTFTAGVLGPFIDSDDAPKVVSFLLYTLFFPFVNMFFYSCISVLFNIYPLREKINGVLVRNDYRLESWLCMASIYAVLIITGLVWRHFRNKRRIIA